MSTVTFYHQERVDDARRTGLYVDDTPAWEQYVPGDEDYDPALRWYVDVRVSVNPAPETKSAVAQWLEKHASTVETALKTAAEKFSAGMDDDGTPWTFDVSTNDGDVHVELSAMKRFDSTHIGNNLRELLKRDWPAFQNKVHAKPVAEAA